MHKIHTFILRVFIDRQEVGVLRGSLQPMPEGQEQTIVDEEGFLVANYRRVYPSLKEKASVGKEDDTK